MIAMACSNMHEFTILPTQQYYQERMEWHHDAIARQVSVKEKKIWRNYVIETLMKVNYYD